MSTWHLHVDTRKHLRLKLAQAEISFSTSLSNPISSSRQYQLHCSIFSGHQPWCPGFLFLLYHMFDLLAYLDGKSLIMYLIIPVFMITFASGQYIIRQWHWNLYIQLFHLFTKIPPLVFHLTWTAVWSLTTRPCRIWLLMLSLTPPPKASSSFGLLLLHDL